MSMKKFISLLLALLLTFSVAAVTLTSCAGGGNGDGDSCTHPDEDGNKICDECGENIDDGGDGNEPENPPAGPGNATYSVTVKSFGGMALGSARIYAYAKDSAGEYTQLRAYGVTDENGVATFEVPSNEQIAVKIDEVPDGYVVEDIYPLSSLTTDITLASKVITDNTDLTGVKYPLGAVARDMEFTTVDGKNWKLSEVLKDKDMVLINFWYVGCSYCFMEFPYMEEAYNKYSDDVAIIALNNYGDSVQEVIDFRDNKNPLYIHEDWGMPYDIAVGGDPLWNAIVSALPTGTQTGYPTSIIIDRYGVVCFIDIGAIPSTRHFESLFEHFTADDYEQKLIDSMEEIMPKPKPEGVVMPESSEIESAINVAGSKSKITYTKGTDDEYAWPFVLETVSDGNGGEYQVLRASNSNQYDSYAAISMNAHLEKGDVLSFKMFSSTERGADIMYVIVDNSMVTSISGQSEAWQEIFAYVANESRDYTINVVYKKDVSDDFGDDTVYIRDVRVCTVADINNATYIPRFATERNEFGEFGNYADVYLGEDGYYHVGSATGPLLLADFCGLTPHSNDNVLYNYLLFCLDEVTPLNEVFSDFILYAQYAVNGKMYGLCPVNEELKSFLDLTAKNYTEGQYNDKSWLEFCKYYDAYGTGGVQLDNPIKGLAPHSAFDTVVNSPDDPDDYYPNEVVYETYFVPRGYWYEFIPETSGAYRITSNSESAVIGFIFLADRSMIYVDEAEERFIDFADPDNVNMVMYFEAGVKYYIDIAFFIVEQTGSFTFKIEYLGESYEMLKAASPGADFTYALGEDEKVTDILIHGGIDAALCNVDGCSLCASEALHSGSPLGTKYWHAVNEDGSLGSIIYADFTSIPSFLNMPIYVDNSIEGNTTDLIEKGAFIFSLDENETEAIYYLSKTEAELREMWGDKYEAQNAAFRAQFAEEIERIEAAGGVEAFLNGKSKIDYTDKMYEYVEKMYTSTNSDDARLYGCVAVDAELGEILQKLVTKYTFEADEAFLKLCYYFHNYGPVEENA